MRIVLTLVVCACFGYLALAKVGEVCDSNDDCDVEECCVHIHSFTKSKCKRLRELGEFCFPDTTSHLDEKTHKYKYMCPCTKGLECVAEEVTELEYGVIEFKDAKCTAVSPPSP